jgi:hypothetical protein
MHRPAEKVKRLGDRRALDIPETCSVIVKELEHALVAGITNVFAGAQMKVRRALSRAAERAIL